MNNQGGGVGSIPGDINSDETVSILDSSILITNWQTNNHTADVNKDGGVSIFDLSITLSNWC